MANFPEPVKITNFSMLANLYRNLNRSEVERLFLKRDHLITQQKQYEAKRNDYKARQMWRNIVTIANEM